jgi:hypothetical protein
MLFSQKQSLETVQRPAERLPTIPELIGSVNTCAFVGTNLN